MPAALRTDKTIRKVSPRQKLAQPARFRKLSPVTPDDLRQMDDAELVDFARQLDALGQAIQAEGERRCPTTERAA